MAGATDGEWSLYWTSRGRPVSDRLAPMLAGWADLDLMVLGGNAIGGLLQKILGTDMTEAEATCATCGTAGPVVETVVYLRGPGTVVRCRTCSGMLMVISQIRGMNCIDIGGLTALGPRQDG